MGCCNVKTISGLGRGKKLKQKMKEGATVRQRTGSPQMTYSCLSVEDPTSADVFLNHRGYWEVRKDDHASGLLCGDLVHEATNIWGNHTTSMPLPNASRPGHIKRHEQDQPGASGHHLGKAMGQAVAKNSEAPGVPPPRVQGQHPVASMRGRLASMR